MFVIKIVLLGIFCCTVFPQYSKAETKYGCVHGVTYWSEKGIHRKGACVACVSLKTCLEQQVGEKERCVNSCHRPKPKLVPSSSLAAVKVPSSTATLDIASSAQLHTNTDQAASRTSTSYKVASSTATLYIGTRTPRVQHASSSVPVVFTTEERVDKKRREKEGNDETWIIWMCTVLGVVFVVGIVAVVWWSRRQGKNFAVGTQDAGEQDTNLSSLNLSPECT